jgi:hypothetical protein
VGGLSSHCNRRKEENVSPKTKNKARRCEGNMDVKGGWLQERTLATVPFSLFPQCCMFMIYS